MVVVIGAISVLASIQSIRNLEVELARREHRARHASLYSLLVQVFVACMLAAVLAANLGALWVAVEATTIATTFLVGHRRNDKALEASWKYVLICSVGIALGFLGTVLVYFAALHVPGHPTGASILDWTSLMSASTHLDPSVVRLGMALLVLGYGTKVGLAPMHSWLPDAHSQAPAPVSALMSGVLLGVAFYALLRFKAVADGALGPDFSRTLLVIVGLASLLVAASLLLTQRDVKRMLAYHSIEHMGLIALLGLPPFSLFVSELNMIRGEAVGGLVACAFFGLCAWPLQALLIIAPSYRCASTLAARSCPPLLPGRSQPAASSGRWPTCSGSCCAAIPSSVPSCFTSTGLGTGIPCDMTPARRPRCAPTRSRSPLSPWKAPASTRSQSARSTPGSSSPATSASRSSARRSSR